MKTKFDPDMDANFFVRLYGKNVIVYINPPFRDPKKFIVRAFILFAYFGMNVVLLGQSHKFNEIDFVTNFVRHVAITVPMEEF